MNGERGAIVLTASVAAYEGQIGQLPYSPSKAGIVGMTLTAARDRGSRGIRVCTIAPGIMNMPLLSRVREDVRAGLEAECPLAEPAGEAGRIRPTGSPHPGGLLPQRRDNPPRRAIRMAPR